MAFVATPGRAIPLIAASFHPITDFVCAGITVATGIEFTGASGGFAIIAGFDFAGCRATVTAISVTIITDFVAYDFAITANRRTGLPHIAADETGFDPTCSRAAVAVILITIVAFFVAIGIEDAIAVSGCNIFALLPWGIGTAGIVAKGIAAAASRTWRSDTAEAFIARLGTAIEASVSALIAILTCIQLMAIAFDGIDFLARAIIGTTNETVFGRTIVIASGISAGDGGITFFESAAVGEFSVATIEWFFALGGTSRRIGVDSGIEIGTEIAFLTEIGIDFFITAIMRKLTGSRETQFLPVFLQAIVPEIALIQGIASLADFHDAIATPGWPADPLITRPTAFKLTVGCATIATIVIAIITGFSCIKLKIAAVRRDFGLSTGFTWHFAFIATFDRRAIRCAAIPARLIMIVACFTELKSTIATDFGLIWDNAWLTRG